jgi:hypothetical protein
MKQDTNNQDPKELAKQKRRENQEKAMDMMFGKDRHIYAGNIWGWKFSIISLIGISVVVVFMIIGIVTGNISLNNQIQEAKEAKETKESKLNTEDSMSNPKK